MTINKHDDLMSFKFKNNNYIDLKIENYIYIEKIIKLKNYKKVKKYQGLMNSKEFKNLTISDNWRFAQREKLLKNTLSIIIYKSNQI